MPSPYLTVTSNFTSEAHVETSLSLEYKPTPTVTSSLTVSTTLPEDSISPLFSGTAWAGTRLWFSAVDSLTYLHDSGILASLPAKPNVLELGAGLGIPGMCIAKFLEVTEAGGSVIITDMPSILEQCEANVAQNFGASSADTGVTVTAAGLDWSVPGINSLIASLPAATTSFDLIVSTDCVYAPLYGDSYIRLAECIVECLRLNPKCISVNVIERRNKDEVEVFHKLLEDAGMAVEVVDRGGGYAGDGVGDLPVGGDHNGGDEQEEDGEDAMSREEAKGSSKGDDDEPRGKVEIYLVTNPTQ
jgi:hypothetical protein